MNQLMCRACGEFVQAFLDDDTLVPRIDDCPSCGGTEFKDVHSDQIVYTDDRSDRSPETRTGCE